MGENLAMAEEGNIANEIEERSMVQSRRVPKWLSRLAKYFLHALWMLPLSVIIAEMILRVFDPVGLCFFDELKTQRTKRRNASGGYYNYYPGDKFVEKGNTVSINSEGFRYDNFPIEKPHGTIRVLCMGDSMVYGFGVPQDTPFWAVLQEMARADGFRCEVIPAGAASWGTKMEAKFFCHRGIEYSPDVMMLLTDSNDFWSGPVSTDAVSLGYGRGLWKEALKSLSNTHGRRILILDPFGSLGRICSALLRSSYMVKAYSYVRLRTMAGNMDTKIVEQNSTQSVIKPALQKIVSVCDSRKIRPLFFIGVSESSSDNYTQMYSDFYTSELEQMGVASHLCVTSFRKRSLRISSVDLHPTVAGHRLIAESMYPHLRSILVELQGEPMSVK